MQEILELVKFKKQEFAQLPLFEFMQDKSIAPRQRLSFAPCMAHFIMSFSDINKYVLRNDQISNPIQEMVNQYTYEDDNHWPWFIADIEKLGFNSPLSFSDTLKFIWGEDTKITRQIAYQVIGYALEAEPNIKILIIQALEATADVFFSKSTEVISELQIITKQEYCFFGDLHLHEETGHTMSNSNSEKLLAEIELTESQRQEAINAVEKIFNIFSEWTYELLTYAHNHPVKLVQSELEKPQSQLAICR
ncbi:hypothetical protein [Brunnivagina elsteri]|uniref:Uncharacterized protein n=1 Tax=Brunnivagina elsteri CCALA 953 TaxID=987040 RepID=A0A2A2TBG7_9CYAN|nr:hypothetical protein [Calothrix elsteri]PAX51052.1 hypothetical protein CK510_26930 [Calothrix elsteri CCALA 953]